MEKKSCFPSKCNCAEVFFVQFYFINLSYIFDNNLKALDVLWNPAIGLRKRKGRIVTCFFAEQKDGIRVRSGVELIDDFLPDMDRRVSIQTEHAEVHRTAQFLDHVQSLQIISSSFIQTVV